MAPGSCFYQSPCVNLPTNLIGEQDEFAGAQDPVKRSNVGSNEIFIEAPIPLEIPTLSFVPPSTENLFIKFIKVFMETTQTQVLAEPPERPLKARTPDTYSRKSYINCYHFCQQYEDSFKTSSATRMNCTPFAAIFFRKTISFRWA